MRTLTLGVLIVAGGTLAALPFRRYQAIPDASSDPIHVTGPTQSELTSNQFHQLADASPQQQREMTLHKIQADVLAASENLAPNLPRWEAPPPEPPKLAIEIPLTFEDLATPIDMPPPLQRRFNATTAARAAQVEEENRVAGILMPKMESMVASSERVDPRFRSDPNWLAQSQTNQTHAPSGQERIQSPDRSHISGESGHLVITEPPRASGSASGSLASSRERVTRRVPQLDPNAVDQMRAKTEPARHWIRQP